jgi:3-oxoacyl-[acyl-carrier-protein] synthase-3
MARTVRSIITGVEKFYPDNVVTNQDLAKVVDTSDEWIQTRTGITQRYRVAKGEASSDLAVGAIEKLLKKRKIDADEIDLIIVGTVTPGHFISIHSMSHSK